jgi:4-oxalocrotonate tautomerase
MPIVHIAMVEGRDDATIKACVKAVARTVSESLGAPISTVRVYATQVPGMHWASGEQTKDEIDTARNAAKKEAP